MSETNGLIHELIKCSKRECMDRWPCKNQEIMLRAASAIECLETELKNAREIINLLYQNGRFDNGNTDPTGSIDEGSVMTGRFVIDVIMKINATIAKAGGESK